MNAHARVQQDYLSRSWQDEDLSLYLGRCQVDTPEAIVALTWREVARRRDEIGAVVDFGAGDGRFARHGAYGTYTGYEIDARRAEDLKLPANASIRHDCAFSARVEDAALCIGNPPFVRNQDLPEGWRIKVASQLEARSGVKLSGLANAWQHFFLLALISAASDGLCALVIPYEWVSRPSSKAIRDFIRLSGWDVDVYRLSDATFAGVLTTSSITIVDKRKASGRWRFHDAAENGEFAQIASESGSLAGHLPYVSRRTGTASAARAIRGLSPGTQRVFTLTDGERARLGLMPDSDVVRCVTSLRPLPEEVESLDHATFLRFYQSRGHRCWLLNIVDGAQPSRRVLDYLDSIEPADYATATCRERPVWWRFKMPETPDVLVATSFKGTRPKACSNPVGVKAVGGVAGIHGIDADRRDEVVERLRKADLADRIVAHANGLRKIEINQLNHLLMDRA